MTAPKAAHTQMSPQQRKQESLLADGTFPSDLAGYAASALVADLMAHWDTCNPPLDAATKRGDVRDAIAEVEQWLTRTFSRGTP